MVDINQLKKMTKEEFLATGQQVPDELRKYWNSLDIPNVKHVKNTEDIGKNDSVKKKRTLKSMFRKKKP